MSRFGIQVLKGFAGNILTAVIGFVGSILFARVLGPTGYGAFYVISAVVKLADNPVKGFSTAGKKRLSESDARASEIAGGALLVGALVTLVLCPLVLLFGIPFVNVEGEREFFVILFVGMLFFKLLQPLIAGSGKFGAPTLLDSGRSFFTITFQLTLVLLGWGVGGMVVGLALGSAVMLPFSFRVLEIHPAWPSLDVVRNMWEYARWSMPKSVVGSAISRMDVVLLSTVLTTGAAGQYRVAMNVLIPATFVSGVIGSGVFIKTSESVSQDESPRERIELGIGFTSILAIPIFFGALAMSVDIVTTIYGNQYKVAGTLLIGLAAYKLFETQSDQLLSAISGFDRPDLRFYISLGVLVTNVTLGIILLSEIGILGIVVATLITGALRWLVSLYLTRQLIDFDILPDPLRKQFAAGLIMLAVVLPLHRTVGVAWWGELLALVSVGAIVYGVVLLIISSHLRVALRSLANQTFAG